MKKILMTLVAGLMAASASAQVYVGGSAGIGSSKIAGGDSETNYEIVPEVGYNINRDWAVGTTIGFGKGKPVNIEDVNELNSYFTVSPYVRYTFVHTKYVNVFADGAFGYTHFNKSDNAKHAGHDDSGNQWSIGIKPGIAVNLNRKVSFVAHVGFLGYKNYKGHGWSESSNAWGVDLDGNNVQFGVYYNF